MIDSKSRARGGPSKRLRTVTLSLVAVAILAGSITISMNSAAGAFITREEHWKYNVSWFWDGELRRTTGLITPKIIIQNETADRLEGYIADVNGTRLTMYDGEQVVMVRYLDEMGVASKWEIADRVDNGYFMIEIPEKYREADTVRIHIGNHDYTVDDGTLTSPQTWVYINSATLNYRTDQALDNAETTETARVAAASSWPSPGSLIDAILSRFGMLPV